MNKYELTVVYPGGVTAAKVKSAKTQIEKIITTMKGEIKKTDEWGDIELAYKMGRNTTGNYVHYLLELDPGAVKAVSDKLNMEEGVLRHLLVRK